MKVFLSSEYTELINKCRQIIDCDVARISRPNDKMFLIIGVNVDTKLDRVKWTNEINENINFQYIQESIVASGFNEEELLNSAREYSRSDTFSKEYYCELFVSSLK